MKAEYNYDFILPFFTTDDDLRPDMQYAHAENGNVYATNAHIVVRIPEKLLAKKYEPVKGFPNAEKAISEAMNAENLTRHTIHVSDLVRVLAGAKWDRQHAGDACPECIGAGEIECPECGHEHKCEKCNGTGSVNDRIVQFSLLRNDGAYKVEIGSHILNADYLHVIVIAAAMLRADEIDFLSTGRALDHCIFSFGGIDILLCPMRPGIEYPDEVIAVYPARP